VSRRRGMAISLRSTVVETSRLSLIRATLAGVGRLSSWFSSESPLPEDPGCALHFPPEIDG